MKGAHESCRKKELLAYERGLRDGYDRALQKFCEILSEVGFDLAASSGDSAEAVPCQVSRRVN